MKKTARTVITSLLTALMLTSCGADVCFLRYALYNGKRHFDEDARWKFMVRIYPQMKQWSDSIRGTGRFHEAQLRRQWLVNTEGDSIRIYIIPARHKTRRTAVLAHGYKDSGIGMMHLAYMYHHDLGYNVLAYDQYAHGASSGKMIQMGWKDRKNLILCARKAEALFGDTIVLHGISMGGATVMMASGDRELPESVHYIVDDCGYTSVWDEYKSELKKRFHLPPFPLLPWTSMICKLSLGWSFKEASAEKAVAAATVPILFIHGDNDTFVPTEMAPQLYEAYRTGKAPHKGITTKGALWLSPGSRHAQSYHDHPEAYTDTVRAFLGK